MYVDIAYDVVITNLIRHSTEAPCTHVSAQTIQHTATRMGWILHMLNHVERFQYISKSCGVGVISVLEMEVEISRQNEIT